MFAGDAIPGPDAAPGASPHLREAELAAVYDRAPSVMCLFDEHLRIVRANRAAAEFAGLSKEDLIHMPARTFFCCPCAERPSEANPPDGRDGECEFHRAVTETLRTGKAWQRVRVKKSCCTRSGSTSASSCCPPSGSRWME
jgi:PAS domain S-box-containing protein